VHLSWWLGGGVPRKQNVARRVPPGTLTPTPKSTARGNALGKNAHSATAAPTTTSVVGRLRVVSQRPHRGSTEYQPQAVVVSASPGQ